MLTALPLSAPFTQITESRRPADARAMLQAAHTLRRPSGRVTLRSTGTRVRSGSRLTISAARLSFCSFFRFSCGYLISFFPNRVTDRASKAANTAIAQGRNGIRGNAAPEASAVKSWREQDTR